MRNQYVANGSCSNFPFTFPTESAADIEVLVNDVATGCTVSGAGSPLGGGVVLVSPPSAGSVVVVRHRGEVTVSDTDARSGHLADKLMAGANATLTVQTAADGFQTVVVSGPDTADFLRKSQNLAELADAAQARANLGLGTAATTDVGTEAGDVVMLDASARLPAVDGSQLTNIPFGKVKASSADTIADFLDTKLVAGANVTITEVASVSDKALAVSAATDPEVTAQLSNLSSELSALSGSVSTLSSDLATQSAATGALADLLSTVIWNQGLLALRSQIGAGWSVLKFVDGIADEFEDESGVSESTGAGYDSNGSFYHNQANSPAKVTPTGPVFGNLTQMGGLAAAFDGVTSQGLTSSAVLADITGYAGKAFTTTQTLTRVVVHAPSDDGYTGTATGTTIAIYGRNGVPSGPTDGALLGATSFVDSFGTNPKTISFPAASYTHFWAVCTNSGGRLQAGFAEIEYEAPASPTDMTLLSHLASANHQPTEARLVLLHQPVDAVTLNTDCTIEVSRDDGTTWAAGTLTDEGAFDATTRILTATVDLSSRPAGTAMRWRFKTYNQKSQRLHGVWMQWR